MGFDCKKCNKMLSSRQRLDAHLLKSVPCDFNCRLCDFQGGTRRRYDYHMHAMHPETRKTAKKQNNSVESNFNRWVVPGQIEEQKKIVEEPQKIVVPEGKRLVVRKVGRTAVIEFVN